MALHTLLGQASPEALEKLPARVRNPERIQQHINAFALHLQGVSYRGIQEHFGWNSLSTAQNSVKRGEELAKDLGLDNERIRLKLANFFDELADITLAQVKKQVEEGQVTMVVDNQGNRTITRRRGVDTKLLGEAGRGAIRFAQFCGLMDATPESAAATTTLIQLSAPAAGADFSDRWSGAATVETEASQVEAVQLAQQPAEDVQV
jgi:ethanolamine utilization microcompartment shell protein EutS